MYKASVFNRCGCCDNPLGQGRPMDKVTGDADDLCSVCRHIVKKAIHYHEDDVLDMATDVWGFKLGSSHEYQDGVTPALPGMDSQ